MGFPWKRKTATHEWVNIYQYKTLHIVNAGYTIQLTYYTRFFPIKIKFQGNLTKILYYWVTCGKLAYLHPGTV